MQWQEAMPLSPRRAGADLLQLQLSRMLQFWLTVRLWVGCIEQSSRTQTYSAVRGYALVVMHWWSCPMQHLPSLTLMLVGP